MIMINSHINKDNKKIIKKYFLTLIPLYLFGIYKNCLLLLNQGYAFKLTLLNPIFIPLFGLLIATFIEYLNDRKWNITFNSLYGFMIGMCAPVNINIIVFILLCFGLLFIISRFFKDDYINVPALIILIIYIISLLINNNVFSNNLELSNAYNYSFLDNILGNQIGALATSSLALLFIMYLLINFDFYFKKEVALPSIILFIIISLIGLTFKDAHNVIAVLINSSVYFPLLLISSISQYSPMRTKTMVFYGSIIGIITGILALFINVYICPYIAITLCSIFYLNKDRLKVKKHIKK